NKSKCCCHEALLGKVYVLVMVDPDAPSRTKPTSTHWRHWLVANIEGRELKKGKIKGKILTEYQPPTPPQKSGFHRYQFMLFEQLPQTPVSLSDEEKSSRGKWDFPAFITRFNLGEPVAALHKNCNPVHNLSVPRSYISELKKKDKSLGTFLGQKDM
uniref:Phosphatidylethanolamine binding protein 4 n=1 Tax=Oryzias latipes TaxID=8090 RepID=A0A3B3IAK4_ORYLA